MNIEPLTTLPELAFIVCTALDNEGITAVLTGGGAATVYAPEAYQSRDLDFILQFRRGVGAPSARPLEVLGFEQRGGVYRHKDTAFTVEFPPGPLSIGNEQITLWDTLKDGEFVLHILTPTDCVRDRLAWFLFNNDYNSLEQALAVARNHAIDLDLVRQWCESEGEAAKFEVFKHRLATGE